jgi:hypothetical protein
VSEDFGYASGALRFDLDLIPGSAEDVYLAVGVENLPTYYGKISWSLRMERPDTLRSSLRGDLVVPRGGVVVKPPVPRPIRQVEVNGRVDTDFDAEGLTLRECPAEAVVRS